MNAVTDTLDRPLHDVRISLTDRCNFRCVYCMPREVFRSGYQFLSQDQLLTFEEIVRVSRIMASMGARKIRLTGGEPLLRRNIETLIKNLTAIEAIDDLSLTTNGSLLSRERAHILKSAGLQRVTVSLDSLDPETFKTITDANIPVSTVLRGIDNAAAAGLLVKINMVVTKDLNVHDVLPMARHFHGSPHVLRFIEYMDTGTANPWRPDAVVSAQEIFTTIDRALPLEPVAAHHRGEVAQRFRYRDGGGEIGIITSVTQPFCRDCTRLRMSSDGHLYTCLFASQGHDMKRWLRQHTSDRIIEQHLRQLWQKRGDRYSETRGKMPLRAQPLHRVEMSYIGG